MAQSDDQLREMLIYLMIENAKIAAAVSPIIRPPMIDLDNVGIEFDRALDEINEARLARKAAPLTVDASFKQAVIDTLVRRMELAGRVVVG